VDTSFPFQKNAMKAKKNISDESYYFYLLPIKPAYKVPWEKGLNPYEVPLSQLWKEYNSTPEIIIRCGIIQFMWEERGDIPKKERLQFLVDVLKNDKSLEVVKLAGHYFKETSNDGFTPLGINGHIEWWEKNKDTIK
jgi:hypothetical protein